MSEQTFSHIFSEIISGRVCCGWVSSVAWSGPDGTEVTKAEGKKQQH